MGVGVGGGGVDVFRGWMTVPRMYRYIQHCAKTYQIESSLYAMQGFEDRKCVSDEREHHQTW